MFKDRKKKRMPMIDKTFFKTFIFFYQTYQVENPSTCYVFDTFFNTILR
jgi:hypothetical protein